MEKQELSYNYQTNDFGFAPYKKKGANNNININKNSHNII